MRKYYDKLSEAIDQTQLTEEQKEHLQYLAEMTNDEAHDAGYQNGYQDAQDEFEEMADEGEDEE